MGWLAFCSVAIAAIAIIALYLNAGGMSEQAVHLTLETRQFETFQQASVVLKGLAVPSFVKVAGMDARNWQELSKLKELLPPEVKGAKASAHRHFTYYDATRPWATTLFPLRGYAALPPLSSSEFLQHVFESERMEENGDHRAENQLRYVYHTQKLHVQTHSWLRVLQQVKFTTTPPNVNLWFGSAGVVAVLHYDIEHNVFIQLKGTKTFYIVEPDAALWVNGSGLSAEGLSWFSSQHPSWRQSQLAETDDSGNGIGIGNATALLLKQLQKAGFKVWEALLKPGDVLYIPPYFLHSVASITASASLNVWSGSEEYAVARELEKLSLPFDVKASPGTKLAAVAALFYRTIHDSASGLQEQQMVEAFSRRNRCLNSSQLLAGSVEDCVAVVDWTICHPFGAMRENVREWDDAHWHGLTGAERQKVLKSARGVHGALARVSRLAVRVLMLFDYLEDILGFVLKNKSSPCAMDRFVHHCLSRP